MIKDTVRAIVLSDIFQNGIILSIFLSAIVGFIAFIYMSIKVIKEKRKENKDK